MNINKAKNFLTQRKIIMMKSLRKNSIFNNNNILNLLSLDSEKRTEINFDSIKKLFFIL